MRSPSRSSLRRARLANDASGGHLSWQSFAPGCVSAGARRPRFDVVLAWSVDRVGRSLQDLVAFVSDVNGYGVDLFLHQQGVDTTTPGGKALFQMMGVFAEFERAMIQERVKSGLERAKAQGKTLGRPPIDPEKEEAIRADLRAGRAGIMKLAGLHGVGVGTVQRIKVALAG